MTDRENPWPSLDWAAPEKVLAGDEPYVHAHNRLLARKPEHVLDLSLPPEPWVGDINAQLVILLANPGLDARDASAWSDNPQLRGIAQKNLAHQTLDWPLYWLQPELRATPGGEMVARSSQGPHGSRCR